MQAPSPKFAARRTASDSSAVRSMRNTLLLGATVAVAVWIVACAFLLIQRHKLIYPFEEWPRAETVSGLPGASVQRVRATDGIDILTWVVKPSNSKPVILYFTGNTGAISDAAPKLREFTLQGFGLVAMNYRGAAGADGTPDQDVIVEDGLRVYDAIGDLLPGSSGVPVIYGTSLGAAVAAQIAARRPVKAVLLEVPFARLCETAQFHYPYVPACWILPDQHWASADVVDRVDAPVLIQHGTEDQVIPIEHGRNLFDAASEPKKFIAYQGGRHNDLRLYGAGIDAINFLNDLDLNE